MIRRLYPHPIVESVAATAALGALAMVWALTLSGSTHVQTGAMVLALCLLAALILSYSFPIHVRMSTKVYMGSAVLYLMAVLLPPPVSMTVTILGVLVGELSVRSRTGNPLGDIATHGGRWGVISLAGSAIAHAPGWSGDLRVVPLCAAAVVLWAGDIITWVVPYAPLTGERITRIVVAIVKEAGPTEAAQYLVGIMAALCAVQYPWSLCLFVLPTALVYISSKSMKEMHAETRRILEGMADAVDLRDPYTGGHSRRVTEYARLILRELRKHGPEAELIISAARVHDIGKIGIADEILRKPGLLTPEERRVIETHPERGAELLSRYPDFARGASFIRHHHESWDGSGYPHRLTGTDIPFGARVIAVADSYDAMTSDRPYRPAMIPAHAANLLRDGRGQQWDATIVDALLRAIAYHEGDLGKPNLRLLPRTEDAVISATTA